MNRTDLRLALPSKGRLHDDALVFLERCGLGVYRPNPRQYFATIPALPDVTVVFQRPGDIVISVQTGSVDFGLTGLDMLHEKNHGPDGAILTLHDALGFSACTFNLAAPDATGVRTVADLRRLAQTVAAEEGRALRVATKFPNLSRRFLDAQAVAPYELISAEGTLEIAPAIGYADVIADLVSTGTTLRDNHLHPLDDGEILRSQACLIANRAVLRDRPDALALARSLLEYIEAHLRAQECYTVVANMRGESAEAVARAMFSHPQLTGLQGPTISRVYPPGPTATGWFAVHIVVKKRELKDSIAALRAVGGSGVIVTPVTYIFEEEPARYRAMVAALAD